ncbi:MAG TPA: tetratricopeptide repeat protein [Flavobacterium sp.]|jgi:tetratricopeptide (TPR) repeat protein
MRKIFVYIALLISLAVSSQNEQLAQNYFDKGDFEKALISYQELLRTQPGNGFYFQRFVESYQQLQRYGDAEKALVERLNTYKQSNILVELGYNYQLQKNEAKAKTYYDQAIEKIRKNPNEVYNVAAVFERRVLIDYALQAYKLAVSLEPKFNFNYQMALLYGQSGNTDMMISMFLDESYANPQSLIMTQNQLSRFMNEDGEATFNESLRKALLVRAQKGQDVFWNQFLSWFFVQQKEYGKAFIQEKAIYKRNPETFSNIVNLAQLAVEEGEEETAKEILGFVLENTNDLELLIQANSFLISMRMKNPQEKDLKTIETDLDALLKEYGISPYTLPLQILQADLLAFHLKNPESAKTALKSALEMELTKYQAAEVKMKLADVFLFEEKFNQALLFYSQIEEDLKNDVVGHEASLKAARTSYFKSDFDWAQSQFKALKSASTQLIANDALEYFLLISDNTVADSTRTALKKFSRADYMLYQNKSSDALSQFQSILKENKGDAIEPAALLRVGRIYEKTGQFNLALTSYEAIIREHPESVYIDEALFYSAEIYNRNLNEPEKAKPLYEKIIFSHQDSIHFVDARKKFRQLRGDTTL